MGDPSLPAEIERLVAQRERARRRGDFEAADALRRRIRDAGFEVRDSADGPMVTPGSGPRRRPPSSDQAAPSVREEAPGIRASVQWVVQGWPEDVLRGIGSFERHHGDLQHVVVTLSGADDVPWPEGVDLVSLDAGAGWAAARNAGLVRAAAPIVLLVDGSVEARGDVVGPLAGALQDAAVGLTGPRGIVTDDLREFRESPGPEVDAVEAYLMAFRRDLLDRGVRFDERFRFYRSADIELSFQVKALGLRATVTPVPVRLHEHRVWANTPEDERARLSKRNFYRFLDRWRGRVDLLAGAPNRGGPGDG